MLGAYLEAALFAAPLAEYCRAARTLVPRITAGLLCAIWLAGNAWSWKKGLNHAPRHLILIGESIFCVACICFLLLWGRNLSAKAGWGLCCVLGFALVLEAANGLIPAWSAQRSPMARSAEIEELVADGHTGVVVLGEEWGSVPFRLNADAVFLQGSQLPLGDVRNFLAQRPRNLILLDRGAPERILRRILPPGMEVKRTIDSGKARIYLAETSQG
jgi:hypothetical protein